MSHSLIQSVNQFDCTFLVFEFDFDTNLIVFLCRVDFIVLSPSVSSGYFAYILASVSLYFINDPKNFQIIFMPMAISLAIDIDVLI